MCVVVDDRELVWKHLGVQAASSLVSGDVHVTKRHVCSVEVPGPQWKNMET